MIITTVNTEIYKEVEKEREERQKEAKEALDANKKEAEEIQKGHGQPGKVVSNKALKAMKLSESLFEDAPVRYSDGKDGVWWYFTTHGVQPGSIPKDLNVIEIKDTPEGTYVALDGILNTSELEEYDMKEKTPPDEIEDDDLDFLSENLNDEEMQSFEKETFNSIQELIRKYKNVEPKEVQATLEKVFSALRNKR